MKKLLLGFVVMMSTTIYWSQAPTPELFHYRFDGTGTTVTNYASNPPAGTATGTIMGGLTQQANSGQCGGALLGTGASSSSDYVNTNWVTNLSGTSWTISFWTNNVPSTTSTMYILGDVNAGGIRVFTGGVAGAGNWILRGSFTDVYANGGAAAGPTMTTFVYDMALNEIRSYVNGVLNSTVAQAGVSAVGTGPFKVGGYSSSTCLPSGSFMDEFRLYNRALSLAEIQSLMITETSSTISVTTCDSYTVPSGGETYTASGTYMDTIQNINGCDSVMTINVNILSSTASTIAPVVCDDYNSPSGNYNWTASGTYMDTIPNAAGCDSVITINLTVNQPTFDTIDVVECDSYSAPDGAMYSVSGVYYAIIPNAAGCDSVITINLTINTATSSSISETTCDEYLGPDNQTYNSSGTYTIQIPNMAGCDSIITLDLTILQSSSSTITELACNEYTAPDGTVYTSSGTYTAVLPNAAGCDSIITINLTVETTDTSVIVSNGTLTVNESGATYQWFDCTTMQPVNGETNQSFTPVVNGTYGVNVTTANCTVASDCYAVTDVGLEESASLDLKLFPNPVNTELNIINAQGAELTLQLFDNSGKLLQTIVTSEMNVTIGMENMASGVYQLRAKGKNAEHTFKVVRN